MNDRAVEPANQRQAYKWRASELKEIKALTELDFADVMDESSVPPGHPKVYRI